MVVSRKDKQVKQKEIPKGKTIAQGGNPEQYYLQIVKKSCGVAS